MAFTTRKLSPFGCEIDLDLGKRSAADDAALQALFRSEHLLVFRNQSISLDQQAELMALFGPVMPGEEGRHVLANDPGPANTLGDGPLGFHSDLSFCPKPYEALCLMAIEVEDGRSSTQFTDATRIAAALPPELRDTARRARCRQVISYDLGGSNRNHPDPNAASHVHPVLRRHPHTGEEIVMVSHNQTAAILDLDEAEGESLLEALCARLYDPAQVYEHVWHKGDLVAWDNLALQHARGPVSDCGVRRLQRVACGEVGLFEQFPGYVIRTEAGSKQEFDAA